MRSIVIYLLLLIVFMTPPVQAELCMHVDDQGRQIITDSGCVDYGAIRKRLEEIPKTITTPEPIEKIKAVSKRVIAACISTYDLKDPLTAYAVAFEVEETRQGKVLWIEGRAKNSFGGYEKVYFSCPLVQYQEKGDRLYPFLKAQPHAITYRPGEIE